MSSLANPPLRCLVLDFFLQGELPQNNHYSLWHGAFGRTLSQIAPALFERLYRPDENRARLYTLVPPLSGYPRLRVTLLGDMCEEGKTITRVIKEMGDYGVGTERSRFMIQWAQYGALDPTLYYGPAHGTMDLPVARDITPEFFDKNIGLRNRLHFNTITPLILKEGNGVMAHPPTFSVLVRRLLGRISQVTHATGTNLPYDKHQQDHWLSLATAVGLVNQSMQMKSFARQSSRTHQKMVFSGWEGRMEYIGPVAPFYGLFKLGEKIQLGGKTAFGFGAFQTFWGYMPAMDGQTHNLKQSPLSLMEA